MTKQAPCGCVAFDPTHTGDTSEISDRLCTAPVLLDTLRAVRSFIVGSCYATAGATELIEKIDTVLPEPYK